MSKRLDDLRKNYENSRIVADAVKEESAGLKEVLAAKQALVMETVRKDLREFAGYAAGLDKGWLKLHLEDCKLDFYRSSYNRSPNLIVAFEPDGNVILRANPDGYSHIVDVYDLKQDRWGWYSKDCKAFVTANWGTIVEQIENELAKALERAAKNVVDIATQKRDELHVAIGDVSQNIDMNARKDIVLYNAISFLIDETLEQYDDMQEWIEMIQKELGVTVEELGEMGMEITADGSLMRVDDKSLEDKLSEAQTRSGGDKGSGKDINRELFN